MRVPSSGLRIDSPSRPLLQGLISYWGTSDAPGSALGTTLVCGDLANQPSYDGLPLKILTGTSAGQVRTIQVHAGNTLTVGVAFTNPAGAVQQQLAGTLFVILSALGGSSGPGPSPTEGLSYYGVVDAVPGANQFTIGSLAGLGAGKFDGATNPYSAFVLRDAGGAGAVPQGELQAVTVYITATGVFTTGAFTVAVAVGDEILIINPALANAFVLPAIAHGFQEQAAVAVNTTAPNTPAENNVLNLAVAGTRYIVRSLRLKCADPGANTVTVRLYELVNGGLIQVDSFDITTVNFATYFSLPDMWGLPSLAGDNLQVTVQASAGGPYVVTGQYSYAIAT